MPATDASILAYAIANAALDTILAFEAQANRADFGPSPAEAFNGWFLFDHLESDQGDRLFNTLADLAPGMDTSVLIEDILATALEIVMDDEPPVRMAA